MYVSNCEIAESVYGRFRFLVKLQDAWTPPKMSA